MVIQILKVRLRQLFREMELMGIIRVLFVGVVLIPLVLMFFYQRVRVSPYVYILPGIVAMLVLLVQRRRRDAGFLAHLTAYPGRICFWEYFISTCWVPVFLAVQGQSGIAGGYVAALAGIVLVHPRRNAQPVYSWLVRFVPDELFEWKSGLRQNAGGVLLAGAVGLAGFFSFGWIMLSFFLFTALFVNFYVENEPLNILLAAGRKNFLFYKLKAHIRSFAVLLLPFLVVSLFLYPAYAGYAVMAYVAALNVLGFALLLKYSYYRPGTCVSVRQLFLFGACCVSVVLPLGILLLLLNLGLYRKASRNLKTYLYVVD